MKGDTAMFHRLSRQQRGRNVKSRTGIAGASAGIASESRIVRHSLRRTAMGSVDAARWAGR